MKTSEITAGKVYGDGLGRKRWVNRLVLNGYGEWTVEYSKVWRSPGDKIWHRLNGQDGICKLVTFASWAKEELE